MAKRSSPTRRRVNLDRAVDGAAVGQRIRAHREQAGISLRELARRLGLSPSAISQIETARSRPSVSTLYAIVSELGMSLDELFSGGELDARIAVVKPVVPGRGRPTTEVLDGVERVQRAGERKGLDLESGVRWERLTAQADPAVDFLHLVYDVGGSSSSGDALITHSGREYGLVLSGSLEVTVGFDTYELGPGDSISFDSSEPHRLRNVADEPMHAVWFVAGRRESDERKQALDREG
ncbi:MAG TPA: helix-turn-helix domain-containing protein [Gaiellaceae bacterium]|jgi:DNA-binding XRE family transcriptional regulator/mannose-6-phosphate isomerase-like protein (cupin superfamily)